MLTLSRKETESVVIDLRAWGLGLIKVMNVQMRGDKVRIGFEAAKEIPVHRREVFEAIEREREGDAA
jgi:carbon storage regulator